MLRRVFLEIEIILFLQLDWEIPIFYIDWIFMCKSVRAAMNNLENLFTTI